MITTPVSIVLEFDEASAGAGGTQGLVVVELDDEKNIDGRTGETKSSFGPGDVVYLRVHHPDNAVLGVEATDGRVRLEEESVHRVIRDRMLFTKEKPAVETAYLMDSGQVTAAWYGNAALLATSGREIAAVGGKLPAIGDISYSVTFDIYRYDAPGVPIGPDDEWPVAIVFRLGGAV